MKNTKSLATSLKLAISFVIFIFISNNSHAQIPDVYLISGQIFAKDSVTPVSFAHIKISNSRKVFTSDWFGHYTLLVKPGESLIFSSMGYKSKTIEIKDTFNSNRLILNVYLHSDTLTLPEANIYDLPTYKQFIEMVAKLDPPDDDFERAKKNLDREIMLIQMGKVDMDYSMNYRHHVYKEIDKLYYKGQIQPNNLINVFSWVQIYKA